MPDIVIGSNVDRHSIGRKESQNFVIGNFGEFSDFPTVWSEEIFSLTLQWTVSIPGCRPCGTLTKRTHCSE